MTRCPLHPLFGYVIYLINFINDKLGINYTFDKLTTSDNMSVRMIDGHIEAQGLQENVLIADQLLGLKVSSVN